ncbi:MAG: hypothetical protein K1X55_17455 [Chitinophagales bacterium]|nr:hypothetical protein [Chitinophagales bacterium]
MEHEKSGTFMPFLSKHPLLSVLYSISAFLLQFFGKIHDNIGVISIYGSIIVLTLTAIAKWQEIKINKKKLK